jgi:hypothetical protein
MGVSGQGHAPASLPPRKRRGINFTGHQCLSGQVRNISPPPGFDPRTIHLVASRNTDCAIPAHPVYYKNTSGSLYLSPSLKINRWWNITPCSPFHNASREIAFRMKVLVMKLIQGGSNMTGTDLCVNTPQKSRSYLNHVVVFKYPNLRSFHSLHTRRHCTLFWGTWIQSTSAYTIRIICYRDRSGTVVKVLRYKSEGRWFDSRWCHWNFLLT